MGPALVGAVLVGTILAGAVLGGTIAVGAVLVGTILVGAVEGVESVPIMRRKAVHIVDQILIDIGWGGWGRGVWWTFADDGQRPGVGIYVGRAMLMLSKDVS